MEPRSIGKQSGDFGPPSEAAAAARDENAGVEFQAPPSEGLTEQAAFTAAPEATAGISSQLLDARAALEDAIHQQGQASGAQSVEALASDVGNIQGVGMGPASREGLARQASRRWPCLSRRRGRSTRCGRLSWNHSESRRQVMSR